MRETEQYETKEEEPREEELAELGKSSRRSFMKTGAAAAGAVALGAAGAGSAAAQSNAQVLVFSYDYYPNTTFRIRANLQASTTVRILRKNNGNTVPEITQPDNYNGYVINYRFGGSDNNQAGIYSFMFSKRSFSQGSTHQLSGNAQVFSSQLNLTSTNLK